MQQAVQAARCRRAPCRACSVGLLDAARPLTVRRDWRAGALQCLLSKARHHCTARPANWLFWAIFDQKVFATNLNFRYQQVEISLDKGNLLSINFKSWYNKRAFIFSDF